MKLQIRSKTEKGLKALVGLKQQFVALKTGAFVLPAAIMGKYKEGIKIIKSTTMTANRETPDLVEFSFDEKHKNFKVLKNFIVTYFSQVRISKKHYEVTQIDEV